VAAGSVSSQPRACQLSRQAAHSGKLKLEIWLLYLGHLGSAPEQRFTVGVEVKDTNQEMAAVQNEALRLYKFIHDKKQSLIKWNDVMTIPT